ncbi:MAG: hypothetical protein QOJ76_1164 [Acidobacteriota bacterium]|nr:hypothetical protein [Acidobacteriota bacterium]
MALFEGKTPAERNKMIAAIALPLFALFFIVYMFSGTSSPSTTNANVRSKPRAGAQQRQAKPDATAPADAPEDIVSVMTPISCCAEPYLGADAGRNIFAFYVKPPPPPAPTVAATPPPTPTPTPPLTLASLAPQSVFARTGNFTLQVSGDKFGPSARVYLDGQEMPTQYKSMQQLTAAVPAAFIAGPGQHSVVVRTPDNTLYSNPQTLNVMQPPAPTYTFVGFLKRQRSNNTAVLKDQKGELYSVRQGDIVESRFRVTDISERGVEVVDKDLNIKHTLPFIESRNGSLTGRAPGSIQPPPPSSEDGEEEP